MIIYVAAVTYIWYITKIILRNVDGALVRRGRFLAGGSAIFILDEWVVKIDLFTKSNPLAKNPDLLANGSIR